MNPCEQQWLRALDACRACDRDLEKNRARMDAWYAALRHALRASGLDDTSGLHPESALARQAQAIGAAIEAHEQNAAAYWTALDPARMLAHSFKDKIVLLVFGKFNAGKSSFCNFVADRLAQQGARVQYFRVEAGEIVASPQGFAEGVVETTAQLQGVCLGDTLVLLDTPGLHSNTDPHAALTQRFLDSADAVLWLTSSTAPGQVQELDELARELCRSKPLLSVITRSDCIEEDEVDGVIVKTLRNKTADNRAVQEADVALRARAKLCQMGVAPQLLQTPVSVSVHAARAPDHRAVADAGFERLYGALLDMFAPTLAYRARKPAEVRLHHLQEQVLGGLNAELTPALAQLRRAIQAEHAAVQDRQTRLVQQVWRAVVADLPDLLEDSHVLRDATPLCDAVTARLGAAFVHAQAVHFGDYLRSALVLARITPQDLVGHASATRADPSAQALDHFQNELQNDPQGVYQALERAVRARVTAMAHRLAEACHASLCDLDQRAQAAQAALHAGAAQLSVIEEALRA